MFGFAYALHATRQRYLRVIDTLEAVSVYSRASRMVGQWVSVIDSNILCTCILGNDLVSSNVPWNSVVHSSPLIISSNPLELIQRIEELINRVCFPFDRNYFLRMNGRSICDSQAPTGYFSRFCLLLLCHVYRKLFLVVRKLLLVYSDSIWFVWFILFDLWYLFDLL